MPCRYSSRSLRNRTGSTFRIKVIIVDRMALRGRVSTTVRCSAACVFNRARKARARSNRGLRQGQARRRSALTEIDSVMVLVQPARMPMPRAGRD